MLVGFLPYFFIAVFLLFLKFIFNYSRSWDILKTAARAEGIKELVLIRRNQCRTGKICTGKDSGIANGSNNWYEETGGERYIIDLVRYILDVSVQIVNIVPKLLKLEIIVETLNI